MSNRQPTRVRFEFFPGPAGHQSEQVQHYHRDLIDAEVLLTRALNAALDGVRPVHTGLSAQRIIDAIERPARAQFSHAPDAPEAMRWFDQAGASRLRPLSAEALTAEVVARHGVTVPVASRLVARRSSAIAEADHAWLEARLQSPADRRPLDAGEYAQLVQCIDGALKGAMAQPQIHANADVAMQAAREVARLHSSYQPAPFDAQVLASEYLKAHAEHLQSLVEQSVAEEAAVWALGVESDFEAAKSRRTQAEFEAMAADRALAGGQPSPVALTVRLETADGRELWWSVTSCATGLVESAVNEVAALGAGAEQRAGDGETTSFEIEVHADDGSSGVQIEGDGDMWRDLESEGGLHALYAALLAGEPCEELAAQHGSHRSPMIG
ncbi:MAG: hypothetical protein EPN79_16075 [Burkholderiaceae bacterium]|nr:MAG: hypothetical protein EPN79_16075 [Burkholderiaceae bacterium]